MAKLILPYAVSALKVGDLTLQGSTSEDIFFQGEVFDRANYTDEYSSGINTSTGKAKPGDATSGYQITDITEAGTLKAQLQRTRYRPGQIPWPFIQRNPSLLVERPHFLPLDIDVSEDTTMFAQFLDATGSRHVMQYRVSIYLEYEESDSPTL